MSKSRSISGLIGGPSAFAPNDFGFTAYRADITDLVARGGQLSER